MLYLHSDKSSHFKLLLEEMKEKFNEQNHYFAQVQLRSNNRGILKKRGKIIITYIGFIA